MATGLQHHDEVMRLREQVSEKEERLQTMESKNKDLTETIETNKRDFVDLYAKLQEAERKLEASLFTQAELTKHAEQEKEEPQQR